MLCILIMCCCRCCCRSKLSLGMCRSCCYSMSVSLCFIWLSQGYNQLRYEWVVYVMSLWVGNWYSMWLINRSINQVVLVKCSIYAVSSPGPLDFLGWALGPNLNTCIWYKGDLGVELQFWPLSLGLTTPPPQLEIALHIWQVGLVIICQVANAYLLWCLPTPNSQYL